MHTVAYALPTHPKEQAGEAARPSWAAQLRSHFQAIRICTDAQLMGQSHHCDLRTTLDSFALLRTVEHARTGTHGKGCTQAGVRSV